MEKQLYDLSINEEFSRIAPPLTDAQRDMLKADLIEHGCISPIVLWKGVIIDGHNRYSICKENNIPFAIIEIELEDETEAKIWILKNQFARRNANAFERCEMVLHMEDDLKAVAEKRRRDLISKFRTGGETALKSAGSEETRDILAALAGVGHSTLTEVKYILGEADREMMDQLRQGNVKIHSVYSKLKKDRETPTVSCAPAEKEPKVAPTEKDPKTAYARKEAEEKDPVPAEIIHLDAPVEVPSMREAPKRDPHPFQMVRDQVRFSVINMIKELQIGLNWLSDEDLDKKEELLEILRTGVSQAEQMIKEV